MAPQESLRGPLATSDGLVDYPTSRKDAKASRLIPWESLRSMGD